MQVHVWREGAVNASTRVEILQTVRFQRVL